MSLVLEALSKAEKASRKNRYTPSAEQEKIGEIKSSFQKKILIIIAVNLIVFSVIFGCFAIYYFVKNTKKDLKPVVELKEKIVIKDVIKPEAIPVNKPAIEEMQKKEYVLKKNYISFENGPEIRINGVIVDEKGAFVLIDGDMYKPGENIDGAVINKITMNRVYLEYKGESYEIRT